MSVADILKNACATHETLFSFEILPPLRGKKIEQIYDTVEQLLPYHPAFIEVTNHRSDFSYRETTPGNYVRVEERVRPGTVAVAYAIQQRYHLPVVPHLICSGYTQQETEYELIDLAFLNMLDVLVLRGDKSKFDSRFIPKDGGLRYANELCEQVNRFNAGQLLYGDKHDLLSERHFSYGVAGYPEKHEEAMSMRADMDALKRKIDCGAEYIITQMVFDNQRFFDFCDRCLAAGINVPIVPGLKPLSTLSQLTMLPKTFHIDFPDELVSLLERCETNDDVKKVGVEWGIRQARELTEHHVPCLHYYTMNAAGLVAQILGEVIDKR